MARQTVTSSFGKWGIPGKMFNTMGVGGDPVTFYDWGWTFDLATTGPVVSGIIPPQGIIRPAKDKVDGKLYVVWEPSVAPVADAKVGWLFCLQHGLTSEPALNWGLPILSGVPDTWAADGDDIDWKYSASPTSDPYCVFPRQQWGIVYDTIPAGTQNLYRSQFRMLRTNGSIISPSADYSFKSLSETIDSKYALVALYVFRLQSFVGTAILADSLYDGDGDGVVDTDDFANDVRFYGVVADFL